MGASKHLKAAMKDKKIRVEDLSEMVDKPMQTIYNMMYRDTMKFNQVEIYAEALGCEVVLRDKETGKVY